MRRLVILGLVSVLLAGCGGRSDRAASAADLPKPGSYVTGGGGISPYYAEELHDGRIHLFGTRATHHAFLRTKEPNPLKIKSYIRKGPGKETVIVETDKDVPGMTVRLFRQFQARYRLAA